MSGLPPAPETPLEQRIAVGRDRKARRLARAIWDSWTRLERGGPGLAQLRAEPREFWLRLADSVGTRHPSEETVALVIAKLETATRGHA